MSWTASDHSRAVRTPNPIPHKLWADVYLLCCQGCVNDYRRELDSSESKPASTRYRIVPIWVGGSACRHLRPAGHFYGGILLHKILSLILHAPPDRLDGAVPAQKEWRQ